MKHRREAQSSALSFIDCICCGFGAVLLLFILTAKSQITQAQTEATQSLAAKEILQNAIEATKAQQKALEQEIAALDPQPDTNVTSVAELAAEQERLAKAIEDKSEALSALDTEAENRRCRSGTQSSICGSELSIGATTTGPQSYYST